MRPVILFRQGREMMDARELASASGYFSLYSQRTMVRRGDLVIGRYSVLPFYDELHADLASLGAELINSPRQHRYAADISAWYPDLRDMTPETWFRWDDVPDDCGPLVVKGRTNSRKFSWKTHMFAEDKRAAADVAWRLEQDAVVGVQDLVFRRYVPLRTYLVALQGLPITEEYRFFTLDGRVLCGAYYWSGHVDELPERPDPARVPAAFLEEVGRRIAGRIRFVVVDVAITAAGEPVVVELNDGQMSGLSDNDPSALYSALAGALDPEAVR